MRWRRVVTALPVTAVCVHLLCLLSAFVLDESVRAAAAANALPPAAKRRIDFTEDVYPILRSRCFACHQGADSDSGIRLDFRVALLGTEENDAFVVPQRSEASRLIHVVSGLADDTIMPPEGEGEPLSQEQIAILRAWIDQGVAWDEAKLPDPDAEHWSFKPVARPVVPRIPGADWQRTAVDAFILRRLKEKGLTPSEEADRQTLMRRLSFILTGLPPQPADVVRFQHDRSPRAYERLVDRLLASPHVGEQLAHMWLDTVRYAETEGYEYDNYLPGLWRYRDYVIESFGDGKPYDQFLREQLAGDQLEGDDTQLMIAAGFHRLGAVRRNAGNQAVASSRNEVLIERTNIIGTALLGLTIGCARCHEHRFDPLPQKDYYRLQAFLAASHEKNVSLADEESQAAWTAQTNKIKRQIDGLKQRLSKVFGAAEEPIRADIKKLENELPPPLPTVCTVVDIPEQRTEIHVLKRGLWEQPGELVGMRMPTVLIAPEAPEFAADVTQPRKLLADQIADPSNPLVARVMVNRLWAFLLGQGIVNTPNDLGRNGDRPSHPELLDYLAHRFVAGGWRIKPLVRQIVLSSAFRQSVRENGESQRAHELDPDNRLLWQFPRRRLTAEQVRDAMLVTSGRINRKMGGRSVIVEVEEDLAKLLYKPDQWQVTPDRGEHDRRSIYLLAKRNLRLPFMEVFDQPNLLTSCASRESSTHALQALELLNGRLANDLAQAFARRLQSEVGDDPCAQVERAFWLAVGRAPNNMERRTAESFVSEHPLREFALALFNLNAFLYVE